MTAINQMVIEDDEGGDGDGQGILGSTPDHLPFCIDSDTGEPIYTKIKKKERIDGDNPDENANTTMKRYKQISFEKEEVGW